MYPHTYVQHVIIDLYIYACMSNVRIIVHAWICMFMYVTYVHAYIRIYLQTCIYLYNEALLRRIPWKNEICP